MTRQHIRIMSRLFVISMLALQGCGGGGSSNTAAIVTPPVVTGTAPGIATLQPATTVAGGSPFTLTVTGTGFVSSSVVDWNGAALPTTYVSATEVTAAVPAANITTAGTAGITVVNDAADGGASAAVSFAIEASGSSGSGPHVLQYQTHQTQNKDTENNSTVTFPGKTMAGSTIWVAVTLSDFAGIHTISVTDTQNNTYTLLDQVNDPAPGSQTVAHFYASNIAGDTGAPDTVTINWTNEDYKAELIAEIGGVTATPLVGNKGNSQDGLAAGSNNITSGTITVGAAQTPALLVSLSMNTDGGSTTNGGSGRGAPAVGTGMTSVLSLWDYDLNLATFATKTLTAAGDTSATFNSAGVDSYVTVAAVFH